MRHGRAALRLLLAWGLVAWGLAVGGGPALAAKAPVPAQAMRLDASVRPLAAELALTLDPAQPRYSGSVEIDVQLDRPQDEVVLHARGLTISQAWVEVGAQRLPAQVRPVDAERIALRPARRLAAGKARLALRFAGTLDEVEWLGLFRRREGDAWSAYTQFEPTGARRAFPLFDEPGWKLPWTLSLTVPQDLDAVSNMPLAPVVDASDVRAPPPPAPPPALGRGAVPKPRGRAAVGAAATSAPTAWKTLRFTPTPPLPGYLLAWAVGRFDSRRADGPDGLPMRVLTPPGRGDEAATALAELPRIVAWQEDFLGMRMPFTQLDSLALPVGPSFGAMEQPGLVTYGAPLLLATPAEATPRFRRELLSIAAHESAHMWFGNLVSLRWWDELWLKESFANWLGDRTADALMPGAGFDLAVPLARARAMRSDRLTGARSVQTPVLRDEDLAGLWNAISYEKGQVLLAMAEGWLGAEAFRDTLRRYLERHAWGHAGGADWQDALAAADPGLAATLPVWIREPGIPLLQVQLQCDAGPPRLALSIAPLRLLGTAAAGPAPRWRLPLRVRTPAGETRLLLGGDEGATATLALPDTGCPAWVQTNPGGSGYWVAAPGAEALLRLARSRALADGEALALVGDARLLHEAGLADTPTLLALLQALAEHPRREVVTEAARALAALAPLRDDSPAGAYAAQWQALFGARARALGWQARAGDGDDERLLRAMLLPWVAELGEDAALRADARRLAEAWLADPAAAAQALDASLRGPVLATAALDGDAALFGAIEAALRRDIGSPARRDLLAALGHFRAPALAERARRWLAEPGIDLRESLPALLGAQAARPETRGAALAYLGREHGVLSRRVGAEHAAAWPRRFDSACSDDEARAIERALGSPSDRLPGGRQALRRTLDAVAQCIAWRRQQGPLPALPG